MLELGPFRDGVIFGSRPGCRAPEAGHAAAVAYRDVHQVAGRRQMLASVTIDHFGWMGLAERAVDFTRLAGALS